MRARLSTLLSVIGAVTVLVLAGNTVAIATTGHGLLLGKINTANRATVLSRTTPGTALVVKTKSSANSPFAVNGKGKVANLNADKLDGIDSAALKTTPYVITKNLDIATTYLYIDAPVPPGTYLVNYSANLIASPNANLTNVRCAVSRYDHPGHVIVADMTPGDPGGNEISVTGTGLIIKASSASTVEMSCAADQPFKTTDGALEPIQFVLVPMSGSHNSTVE